MSLDIIILVILLVHVVLHIIPRPYLRQLRCGVARLVFWQWKKMSRLSAALYWKVYQRVNGNGDDNGTG